MLLLPNAAETEESFRARFIADGLMTAAFPEEVERTLLSGAAWRDGELVNASPEGFPKRYESRFILPGLARYDEDGVKATILVDKEALDKMMPTFAGKPVYDRFHPKLTTADDFKNGKAVGIVTKAWFNSEDGWYWNEFYLWDQVAQQHCENGIYGVSCTYKPTAADKTGGLHNNVPYDWKILDGQYIHNAIVLHPRYEGVRIVVCNSQGGSSMKLFGLFGGKKNELDPSKTIEIGGKQVALKDAIEIYNAKSGAGAAAGEQLADDAVVEIDGKEVKVADIKATFAAHQNALTEKATADAAAKAEKEKKDLELANAKKTEDEKVAKEKADKEKNLRELENARLNAAVQEPKISTRRDQAVEGAKRYSLTPSK